MAGEAHEYTVASVGIGGASQGGDEYSVASVGIGLPLTPGHEYTVTSLSDGTWVRYWNGAAWDKAPIWVWDGSAWISPSLVEVWDGSSWADEV